MSKVLGIGALVLGVWCATEVYTQGAANAFGGALSRVGLVEESKDVAASQTPGRRVGSKAQRAHDEAAARREKLLAD